VSEVSLPQNKTNKTHIKQNILPAIFLLKKELKLIAVAQEVQGCKWPYTPLHRCTAAPLHRCTEHKYYGKGSFETVSSCLASVGLRGRYHPLSFLT
jgi:hypothetical protein